MKHKSKILLVLFSLVLLIGITLPVLTACDPGYRIQVENRTEQVLNIYYDSGLRGSFVEVGNVKPGEHIFTPPFLIMFGYCQIDARNTEGELIFSKEYFWRELSDMGWTVVITPPIIKAYAPIEYSDGDEYIAFTAEGAVPCFSFEYPSDYNLLDYTSAPEFRSTSVRFTDVDYYYQEYIINGEVIKGDVIGCPPEAEWDYKHIEILVDRISEYSPEAEIAVDEAIATYERWVTEGWTEDFRLLEKNRVIVAGLEGWEIVISFTSLPVFRDGPCPSTRAVDVVYRGLFIDYQNTVWEMRVYSDAASAEQARLDYEHILGTLRILE